MKRSPVSEPVVVFGSEEMFHWRVTFNSPIEEDDDVTLDVDVVANNHAFAIEAAAVWLLADLQEELSARSTVLEPGQLIVVSCIRKRRINAAYIPKKEKS